jgi:hypothetical protein
MVDHVLLEHSDNLGQELDLGYGGRVLLDGSDVGVHSIAHLVQQRFDLREWLAVHKSNNGEDECQHKRTFQ